MMLSFYQVEFTQAITKLGEHNAKMGIYDLIVVARRKRDSAMD
jgi:hypothetical protein